MEHSGGAGDDCPEPDLLASDGNAVPTMNACRPVVVADRSIAQDDINGFHVARQGSPLPTANDSFEYSSPTYGWGYRVQGSGGVSRICDGTSYHKSCRLQDTGAGTSVYQDIVSRGGELNSHNLFARAWMRSSSGASISATVAVWNLNTGKVVISRTCTIGTTWSECRTGTFSHTSGTRLRVEVYNNTGTNLNHDLVSLRW